jgi:hypothetical protein
MLACLTELRYVPYQNFHNVISLFRPERNEIADYQFAGSGNEARNTEVTYWNIVDSGYPFILFLFFIGLS